MTFQQYVQHYLQWRGVLMMLVSATAVIAASLLFILAFARKKSVRYTPDTRRAFVRDETVSQSEKFYELIFSNTSILVFVAAYFMIDYFGVGEQYRELWDKYNGIILLLFIVVSIVFTSFMDNLIIPLKNVHRGERSSMRLMGMLYMLIVFAYIKFIYEDSNYDSIIIYFLTLVIGRFVYFDATIESFGNAMKETFSNLPLLALALICTAMLAWVGFGTGYLLKLNGVVFNLFIAHVYLLLVIFIVHRSRLLQKTL